MEWLIILMLLLVLIQLGNRPVGGGQRYVSNAPLLRIQINIPGPPPRSTTMEELMSETEKTETTTTETTTEAVAAPVTTDASQSKEHVETTETKTTTEES